MSNFVNGKSIIVTGAASGFGKLVSEKAAALGARITCADVNLEALQDAVAAITAAGGQAQAVRCDVTDIGQMQALAAAAVKTYGRIDVMFNNAGVMPLALYADHQAAVEKWHRCIDINFKGVLNGIIAVYDQMMAQGEGHVINVSSIYGNFPTFGGAVYGATKSAVNFLSDSLRVEGRGRIKVTIVKPTGVPATNLGAGVVNIAGAAGIAGQNTPEFFEFLTKYAEGRLDPADLDPDKIGYLALAPEFIADQVIHAINQPKGVVIGEITVRAGGDYYIL